MTIVLTWAMFKWAGLALFILSLFALFGGNLPDHYGNPLLHRLRYVVWPLFLVWLTVIFFRGLVS